MRNFITVVVALAILLPSVTVIAETISPESKRETNAFLDKTFTQELRDAITEVRKYKKPEDMVLNGRVLRAFASILRHYKAKNISQIKCLGNVDYFIFIEEDVAKVYVQSGVTSFFFDYKASAWDISTDDYYWIVGAMATMVPPKNKNNI